MELEPLLKELILELEIRDCSKRTLKSYKNNNLLFFTFIKKEFDIIKVEDVKDTHIYIMKGNGRKDRRVSFIRCQDC